MKNVKVIVGFGILIVVSSIIVISLSKQSNNLKRENQILKTENAQLENKVYKLEKDIGEIKSKQQDIDELSIFYDEVNEKVRFIEKQNYILALPKIGSKIMRHVWTNTLATVYEKAIVHDETWIFVEIPTYDCLINNRGWIKEADTTAYTKDKIKLVQSDVEIKVGFEVYRTDEFKEIKNTTPVKSLGIGGGRLQEKKGGYCKISQAGGRDVWVKESSVVYPKILGTLK